MKHHRIVLDTNVLISAILFGGPPREALNLVISGTVDCSLSLAILFGRVSGTILEHENDLY